MSQNVYIGMTLKPWPILLDHYSQIEDHKNAMKGVSIPLN